ncbi:MAG TPA: 7-cyano-7-deazaguanine synthase [Thermoguttaceae bacterium]|nr:7-cyano-7-deazaguanine synthase [Thermoguttaceae bacterium]
MTVQRVASTTGLLLSGGLDSSILLGTLLNEGCRVRPFYVRTQLAWEPAELRAVRRWLEALSSPRLDPLVLLDLPLADLYQDHWSVTGRNTPDGASPDDAVYLPGRNSLLLIKAALWCQLHGIEQLALGVLESNPFADATAAFFDHFESALNCGSVRRLRIVRPFARLGKRQVMERGRDLPLGLTFSCIAPVGGLHCGQCNKCAERNAAFRLIDAEDPTEYAVPLMTQS